MKIIEKNNEYHVSLEFFKEFYLDNNYDDNMFNSDGSLNPNYNSFKKTGIISQILEDHWDSTYKNNKELIDTYRPNADFEINKTIDCHNKNLGCSVYECPNCNDFVFVGHTCKSRFCSSCGYKYKLQRVEAILETSYNCNHRQIVLTMARELTPYFFSPFADMIDILFLAVRNTIYSILNESFKFSKATKKKTKYSSKIKFTPGFFAFLHTFGRDLKWNPHIHILIAELKIGSDNSVKKWDYFNYDALSKRFQKNLLDLLHNKLGSSFSSTRKELFNKYKNGFYVYAEPKKFNSFKQGVEYVTRYCGRAPISENRIVNYDGQNVTFCYNDHRDEEYHEITISAQKFIMILIRHLLPHQFKIIRYYGFYRKKPSIHDKMVMLIDESKKLFRKQFLNYQFSILKHFNRDPYCCPKCNEKLRYIFEIS